MKVFLWVILFSLSISLFAEGLTSEEAEAEVLLDSLLGVVGSRELAEFHAVFKVYRDRIEDYGRDHEDYYITVDGTRLYYADGRIVTEESLPMHLEFRPIFYHYRTGEEREENEPDPPGTRLPDFLATLIGPDERSVRRHLEYVNFLGWGIYMNEMAAPYLRQVEADILEAAESDPEVADYIDKVDYIESFYWRRVAGTGSISYHGYGLAVDLLPSLYYQRPIYWQWLSNWRETPFEERWHVPQKVVDIFEEHGFLWGGKWYHFDNMHFEFRPEIIYLSGGAGHNLYLPE